MIQSWQNSNTPWPEGAARYFIVGTSNTGKTTLACRIIKKLLEEPNDPKDLLVLVSPNYQRDQKLIEIAKFASARGIKVRVYTKMDKKSLKEFVAYMDEWSRSGKRTTVFIDDPVGIGNFTSNVNQNSPFNSFVTSAKHFKSDIIFSTQAIGSMSKSARKNVDVFIFLPDMVSRKESYEACRFVHTQMAFDSLMDRYATKPFNALWINVQYGRKGVYAIDEHGEISSITAVPE